jgi:hypothetical protein
MKTIKLLAIAFALCLNFSCSTEEVQNETSDTKSVNENEISAQRLLDAGSYSIKRYVFSRSTGAGGLGHVGVGVEIRTTNPTTVRYYCGAVENESASFIVLPGGNNGGWYQIKTSYEGMFNEFKNRRYNYLKFTKSFQNVTKQRALNTVNEVMYLPGRGYSLAGNNCMNATYDVLNQGGGLFIPAPTATAALYAPNVWFNSLATTIGWSNQSSM